MRRRSNRRCQACRECDGSGALAGGVAQHTRVEVPPAAPPGREDSGWPRETSDVRAITRLARRGENLLADLDEVTAGARRDHGQHRVLDVQSVSSFLPNSLPF